MAGDRAGICTAGGSAQTLIFDARGNIIGVEDGNRISATDGEGHTTAYTYDAAGNVTFIL